MIITVRNKRSKLYHPARPVGWGHRCGAALGAEIEKIEKGGGDRAGFQGNWSNISSSGIRQVVAAYKKAKAMEAELFCHQNVGQRRDGGLYADQS